MKDTSLTLLQAVFCLVESNAHWGVVTDLQQYIIFYVHHFDDDAHPVILSSPVLAVNGAAVNGRAGLGLATAILYGCLRNKDDIAGIIANFDRTKKFDGTTISDRATESPVDDSEDTSSEYTPRKGEVCDFHLKMADRWFIP